MTHHYKIFGDMHFYYDKGFFVIKIRDRPNDEDWSFTDDDIVDTRPSKELKFCGSAKNMDMFDKLQEHIYDAFGAWNDSGKEYGLVYGVDVFFTSKSPLAFHSYDRLAYTDINVVEYSKDIYDDDYIIRKIEALGAGTYVP